MSETPNFEDCYVDYNYYYLCGNCGQITRAGLWLYLRLDEETEQLRVNRPDESDPICRCPICRFDHTDDDGDPGLWDGTYSECAAERLDLSNPKGPYDPDYTENWIETLNELPKLLEPWEVLGVPHKRTRSRLGFNLNPPVFRPISNGDHRKLAPITALEGDAVLWLIDYYLDSRNTLLRGTSWPPLLKSLQRKLEEAGYANPY